MLSSTHSHVLMHIIRRLQRTECLNIAPVFLRRFYTPFLGFLQQNSNALLRHGKHTNSSFCLQLIPIWVKTLPFSSLYCSNTIWPFHFITFSVEVSLGWSLLEVWTSHTTEHHIPEKYAMLRSLVIHLLRWTVSSRLGLEVNRSSNYSLWLPSRSSFSCAPRAEHYDDDDTPQSRVVQIFTLSENFKR